MEDRNYTVYMHVNKSNGKKYVGITSLPVHRRWRKGDGYKGCTLFFRAIKKHGWDDFEHLIIAENFSKEEAEKSERYLIATYGTSKQKYGYNIEHGGNAPGKLSQETKDKISIANKGKRTGAKHHAYGKKFSIEHIANLKKSAKGKHSGESNYFSGKSGEKSHVARKVICISTNEIFNACVDASKKYDIDASGITKCCRGKRKTIKSLTFMYYDDYIKQQTA